MLFVAPGVTKPGSSTNQIAETVDIFPTLPELAGLEKLKVSQPIDGIRLVPVLENGDIRLKNQAYHSYIKQGYLGEAIRTEQFRMVRWTHIQDASKEALHELYDYKTDPHETQNRAAQNPGIVKELEKLLTQHPKAKTQPG